MHVTQQLSFAGAVDADGHILEPPDLWETYLEPQYRDRALRFVRDADGLEALEIGGKPSIMSRKGFPSTLGAMGDPDLHAMQLDPERTYLREAPYGSMDPAERLAVLDAEGIDAVVLYTTVGLLWEAELDDPELAQAYTARTTVGSASSAPATHASSPPRTSHSPIRLRPRASWNAPLPRAHAVPTLRRSPTTAAHSVIPRTTRCSRPRRISTCRSRSTPRSSRSGRRARAWARGRTSSSCACSRR